MFILYLRNRMLLCWNVNKPNMKISVESLRGIQSIFRNTESIEYGNILVKIFFKSNNKWLRNRTLKQQYFLAECNSLLTSCSVTPLTYYVTKDEFRVNGSYVNNSLWILFNRANNNRRRLLTKKSSPVLPKSKFIFKCT